MEWDAERTTAATTATVAATTAAATTAATATAATAADDATPAEPAASLLVHSGPSPSGSAQDVLALALVAIAAGSLAWRMARFASGFFASGRSAMAAGTTGDGKPDAWSGGCGGGCSGCPSNAPSIPASASRLVTISGLGGTGGLGEPRAAGRASTG